MSKSILITGSSGFIGSALSEFYLNQNYHVIGIDNFCTGYKQNTKDLLLKFPKTFHFFEKDVIQKWDFSSLLNQDLLKNLTHIFHLASPASPKSYLRLPMETLWANSIGLSNALQFADQYQARLIFASTSEVYGDPLTSPQSENYWGNVNSFGARSCYDEAKRFGEALLYNHNLINKTQHGLFRLFNTYGPGMNPQDGRVMINLIQQALTNQPLTLYGDGNQTRCFCYIDDAIQAIHLYSNSKISRPFNIGSDQEITINETAKLIKKALHSKSEIIYQPIPQDDPKQRRPDLTLFRQNWPEWEQQVSLEQGILKTAQALK